MNTCPACQKTHDEVKYYCDCCLKYYCSIECLKYQNFPEYDNCEVRKLTDWEFSCCGLCYCAKCHICLKYSETDEIISVCDMCNRLFHDDCDSYIDNGSKSCMCRLCVDLNSFYLKKMICKNCHDKHNVKQFYLVNLEDVKQYASYDLSNCKKFKYLKENSFNNNFEISDCLSINCDCEACKNIKCPTTLIRLMFGDRKWNDEEPYMCSTLCITPIFILNELASSSDNNCNCEVCQFWKDYN